LRHAEHLTVERSLPRFGEGLVEKAAGRAQYGLRLSEARLHRRIFSQGQPRAAGDFCLGKALQEIDGMASDAERHGRENRRKQSDRRHRI